jgi:hypothetical protein
MSHQAISTRLVVEFVDGPTALMLRDAIVSSVSAIRGDAFLARQRWSQATDACLTASVYGKEQADKTLTYRASMSPVEVVQFNSKFIQRA